MISSVTLFPPTPSFPTGAENPQPDGSFTLVSNDDTKDVFSLMPLPGGFTWTNKPAGTATANEKMYLNVGGGSVNLYVDGLTYCVQYDGRHA